MKPASTRLLNDGHWIPRLGFGTWPLDDDEAAVAVEAALKAGYRLIDTASRYGNETGVGRGLQAAGLPRSDVFVTTKLRGQDHGFDATLRAFIRLRDEGRVRSIGVSNFQPHHLQKLVDETGVVPSVNQVELHPDLAQQALVEDAAKRGIVLEAWSPLGRGGDVLKHDAIVRVAKKHGRSPAQIILRWHVERDVIAIPKSKDPERMRQNLDIFDFKLDAEDLAAFQKLDRGHRMGGDPDVYVEE